MKNIVATATNITMTESAKTVARGALFVSAWLLGGGLFAILYAIETGGIDFTPFQWFVTAYLTAISVVILVD